jgi:NAD(P)-dependent dehydrogenase (short-subunit alcohol dehydrogenase family)
VIRNTSQKRFTGNARLFVAGGKTCPAAKSFKPKLKHKDTIRIAVITAGDNGSLSMITKGGLNTVIRNLTIEYAKEGIRFKAVALGVVHTPMHKHDSKEFPKTLQPMRKNSGRKRHRRCRSLPVRGQVAGEVLHVDGGAQAGRW